jgi:hypothetical protein
MMGFFVTVLLMFAASSAKLFGIDGNLRSNVHHSNVGDSNVIMTPPSGKSGNASALIFFIGAYCKQEAYLKHLQAIQEKVPFPLWVAIPWILDDLPIPVGLSGYVDSAKDDLEQKGFTADKYFFGGHSLGGSSVASWAHSNVAQVEGVILWGSYVSKSVPDFPKNYGAPVLTVGAELDGWMARITRIAEAYDKMKTSTVGYENSKYSHPVVLIPGMNHASFLSGTPPSAVQETDLRANISIDEAIRWVSNASSAFLTITRLGKDKSYAAVKMIDYLIDNIAAPLLEPVIDMYRIEGAPFISSFNDSTPWVQLTQAYVVGDVYRTKNIEVVDEYKSFVIVSGDFSHAKPKIQPSETNPSIIDVLSYSHAAYNPRTSEYIDAANFYAATEVGAKFKSREAVYNYFGMKFNVPEATCKEINIIAFQYVLDKYKGPTSVINRYVKFGQPIEFLNDTESESGITWVNRPIITKNTSTTYQVSSRSLLSPIDFPVSVAAGMLYCKLISPARILEWMLVDGLKKTLYWAPYQSSNGLM